jgi:hypothetical protein
VIGWWIQRAGQLANKDYKLGLHVVGPLAARGRGTVRWGKVLSSQYLSMLA